MRTALTAVIALAAAIVAAPAALAATLDADARCYQETQDVVLNGTGFNPQNAITVTQDGEPIGTAASDSVGSFRAKFRAPRLAGTAKEELYDLSASDGVNTAITQFRVTKVFADFSPGSGDPSTLRVRFTVNGFGLRRRHAPVYLHYVRPSGKLRRTIRIGTATGSCGLIRHTRKRRLFPFDAERGRWILQFDTQPRYVHGRRSSPFTWVRKPVEVFNRSG